MSFSSTPLRMHQLKVYANMTTIQLVQFPGFESMSYNFPISAAAMVAQGSRLVVTSGHIGMTAEGTLPEELGAQVDLAFEVYEDP